MGKIKVLDKTVANMIAAGEVVERPASAVKELIENAVDAGATRVTVEIRRGGVAYLRVSDNGSGMTREDAKTSLLRHATSKVRTAEDLAAIGTLGFRGEALSSIAAVSHMEITTRTAEDGVGTRLTVEAGELLACEDIGCPVGTTMVVADLFANVPARMKFLKKDGTEAGYVADVVHHMALSHPEVSFTFLRDGKEALFTAGDGTLSHVVHSVYGKEVARAMLPVSYTEGSIGVTGLAGKPELSRANRTFQSFFLNGRYIKSPLLSRALDEAYRNQLMTGKFPACILCLTLPLGSVDVNVHPTKLEVKFSDERQVYRAVYWAVQNALYAAPHIPKVGEGAAEAEEMTQPARAKKPDVPAPSGQERPKVVRPFGNEVAFTRYVPVTKQPPQTNGRKRAPQAAEPAPHLGQTVPPVIVTEQVAPLPQALPDMQSVAGETGGQASQETAYVAGADGMQEPSAAAPVYEQPAAVSPEAEPRVAGQVFETYIVVEKGDEMYLVDQHAAHERLRYEALLKQFEARAVASQGLLVPVTVELSGSEMALLQENQAFFEALGFAVEPYGDTAVIIRSSPEELDSAAMRELFVECLDMLRNGRNSTVADMQRKALYSISCKGALKANHRLDMRAMETLVKAVFALPNINTCPHGRPIVISFPKRFIEKQFKRIV